MLLGALDRPTRDLDIVATIESGQYLKADPLPAPLQSAAEDVSEALGVAPDWLNEGPADLLDFGLPEGFAERAVIKRYGTLTLHIASRRDQVFLKLYAATDQGPHSKHFQDLRLLEPTPQELIAGARWAVTHDPSPDFRTELLGALASLGVIDAEQHL
jgi:hypothetical protein